MTIVKDNTPEPHQKAAIKASLKEFKVANRATVAMPCGSGKSFFARWLAEKLMVENMIVFVPSISLLQQTLHTWLDNTSINPKPAVLGVCSDKTVTHTDDEIVVDLNDLDFDVSTNPEQVSEFLASGAKQRILFCTYDSAWVIAKAVDDSFIFDFAIFDEAHKTAGLKDNKFGFALDDANLKINKRLFMTATPVVHDYTKIKDDEAALVASMDNEDVYGKICYRLTVAEAIEQGVICDYEVIIAAIDPSMISTDEIYKSKGDSMRDTAVRVAVQKSMEKHNLKKAFTFHSRIANAKDFATNFNREFGIKSLHIQGKMPSSERKEILADFALSKPPCVLSNARCLTEGVDVPDVDLVAFADPKKSKVDIIQACGRAMRIDRNNPSKKGYILIPLFVENADDVDDVAKGSNYDGLIEVLGALKDEDSRIEAAISAINKSLARDKTTPIKDLGSRVKFIGNPSILNRLKMAVSTYCIDRLGDRWERMLERYNTFVKQHGREPSGNSKNQTEKAIANWAGRQRTAYKQGKLDLGRVAQLNKMGFVWNPRETRWQSRQRHEWQSQCVAYFAFQEEHDREPLRTSKNKAEKDLAVWASRQRTAYKKGKLDSGKIAQLNKTGFVWNPKTPLQLRLQAQWQSQCVAYFAFQEEHGHAPSYYSKSQAERQLAKWSYGQRTAYKQGKLDLGRVAQLNKMGFVWNQKTLLQSQWQSQWQSQCVAYFAFQEEHGHAPSSYSKNQAERQLGRWAQRQRDTYKQGKLDLGRVAQLNEMGFVWNPRD